MHVSRPGLIVGGLLLVAVVALVWIIASDRRARPYGVPRQQLTGWTIVPGEGADPWVLALRPPDALATALYTQLASKTAVPLERPFHTELPLVLRSEYEEGLQGVYGVDTITQIARDAGVESTTLTPVCVARRLDSASGAELVFVVFDSAEFQQMRRDLMPAFPEHAGTGIYDPATLTPVLPIATSRGDLLRWWPLGADPATDCQAPLRPE